MNEFKVMLCTPDGKRHDGNRVFYTLNDAVEAADKLKRGLAFAGFDHEEVCAIPIRI